MIEETLHHRGTTLVRRTALDAGGATSWHFDPFHRVSVVLNGYLLAIEFGDSRPPIEVRVSPGQVDWDEPCDHIHRVMNIGYVPLQGDHRVSPGPPRRCPATKRSSLGPIF